MTEKQKYVGFSELHSLESGRQDAKSEWTPRRQNASGRQDASGRQKESTRRPKYRLTARIDLGIAKQMKLFCLVHKLSVQEFIEQASVDFMTSVDAKTSTLRGSDDHDLSDDSLIIINLFESIIETKYRSDRDDNALTRIRKFKPTVIESGFIIAKLRAKSKINSMAYCVPVIEEVANAGIADDGFYLQYLRSKLSDAKQQEGKSKAPEQTE